MRILALLFLLLPFFGFSQTVYRGEVRDAITGNSIPFATIGLVRENTGVSADENGLFELRTNSAQASDSLFVGALGYQSLKTAATAFSGKIVLFKRVQEIKEVSISPKPLLESVTLNKNGKSSNAAYGTNGSIAQIAQHFSAPALPALLTAVAIRKLHIPLFVPANGIFRLRIYGLNPETGGPGADLISRSIEVTAKGSKIQVDLTPYRIYLPEKEFFVAIEWLKIPENEHWFNDKENGKK